MKKWLFLLLCISTPLAAELSNDTRELYLDLMKKCLLNTIYEDSNMSPFAKSNYNPTHREIGMDWPLVAHTMIGKKRLDNIHECANDVIMNDIPGDFIETGVWRGGTTIFMRALLKAYGDTTRHVWVADSFEGLPPPNPLKYPEDQGLNLNEYKELAISLESVKNNFSKYNLLDDQVIFLKGFFSQTLPTAPIERISILRLDGDLYNHGCSC